ncbi:MAG: DegT/DnrJ/EryC1/StrS family aminotransferase [Verrucomicrobiae bacterium]|nr:DegT/DnrJ/EryC1/StrS family aminotransferase [Verrucomicrobiae bacterium]
MKTEIPITRPLFDDREIEALAQVIRSGWVTQGPKVAEFEKAVSDYTGARYAVATTSWSTAMFLAMHIKGIGPGDEVILPSFTCVATANAIRATGAMPVFVDMDRRTFNLDPNLIEPAITPRTKAVMAVHYYGMAADMDAINAVARRHNLWVFEDAAVALGASYQGKKVGNLGAPTGFSFHGRKIITTGDGGMLTTNDEELAARARIVRSHGVSVSDFARHQAKGALIQDYVELGYNFRMTDLQGAVGVEQMKKLPLILSRRQALAARYDEMLAEMPEVETPYVPPGYEHSYQTYLVWLTPKCRVSLEDILKATAARGVSCRHSIICHTQPFYRKLCGELRLPVTEEAARRTLALPLYPQMTEEEQNYVVATLKDVLVGGTR